MRACPLDLLMKLCSAEEDCLECVANCIHRWYRIRAGCQASEVTRCMEEEGVCKNVF